MVKFKFVERNSSLSLKVIVLLLFFFSGVSSILYQVIWQRYLTFSLGSDTISSTIVVSVFMLGLGLGSLFGGWFSDKLSTSNRLIYYAVIEALIALFGIGSHFYLYDFIYVGLSGSSLIISILFSFVFLIVPTFLMGITLPLLSKLFDTSVEQMKSFTFILYTANTLGAAAGAFLPIFFLFPIAGFPTLFYFAAFLNILCAIGCFSINSKQLFVFSEADEKKSDVLENNSQSQIALKWYFLAAISGYVSISLEMIWFRVLNVILKGNAFTFPILLTIFLAGIGMGGAVGFFFRKKIKDSQLFFSRMQALIGIYSLLSLIIFIYFVDNGSYFTSFKEYLYNYGNIAGKGYFMIYHLIIPLLLFGVPTIFMGFSFVCLQESINHDKNVFGKNLGRLLFVNIFSSAFATICTVFLIFHFLGTTAALAIIGILCLLVPLIHFFSQAQRTLRLVDILFVSILCFSIFMLPSNTSFWTSLYGSTNRKILIKEDKTTVSSIKINEDNHAYVFTGGLGQSNLPYKEDINHIELGIIPILIHPAPTSIAVIGFGSGATLYGISSNEMTKEIDCFEIVSEQYELIKEYGLLTKYVPINLMFKDKRINFKIKDGRRALISSFKKYDIIEADALRPNSPYAGNLYSVSYFELLKSKLNKNGIAVTWAPTERISNGFRMVFPFVVSVHSFLIGSNEPIIIDSNQVNTIQQSEFWRNKFQLANIHPDKFNKLFKDMIKLEQLKVHNNLDYNTDVFPKDELYLRPSKAK